MKMQCPICGEKKETDRVMMDGHILMEEHFECSKKHYEYHYVTGYTQELIQGHELSFSYKTPYTMAEEVMRKIYIMIAQIFGDNYGKKKTS